MRIIGLSFGNLALQNSNQVDISGGKIVGITDLAVADGGTGASTPGDARDHLDVYSRSEVDDFIISSQPTVSILDPEFGAVGDRTLADDTAAFAAAIATGKPVLVPETPNGYKWTGLITDNGGGCLIAIGRPKIYIDEIAEHTVAISIASPGVINEVAHGRGVNSAVKFSTTGALPTGLLPGVFYFVKTVLSADTYTVSAIAGGTAINTSGSQFGTHVAIVAFTATALQVNGSGSLYKGLHFVCGNATTNYRIIVGALGLTTGPASHNRFEDITISNGDSGIKTFGPHNEFIGIRGFEFRGTMLATSDDDAHDNFFMDCKLRNGATSLLFEFNAAHHNRIHFAEKWTDPAFFSPYLANNLTPAARQTQALDGFLGGDIVTRNIQTYDCIATHLVCRGVRDGCSNVNGTRHILDTFRFEDTAAGSLIIAGSYAKISNGIIRNAKSGLGFQASFGGIAQFNTVTNLLIEDCWGYGVFVEQDGIRAWTADTPSDDDPDYFYYVQGGFARIYKVKTANAYDPPNSGIPNPDAGGSTTLTGSTPPTWTSGDGSDGVNILTFLNSVAVADLSGQNIVPNNNTLIGVVSRGNAWGDWHIEGTGSLKLIGCQRSRGQVIEAGGEHLFSSEGTYTVKVTTTDATPTAMTFDGNPTRFISPTTGGTSTAYTAAVPGLTSATVDPFITIPFHTTCGANPTFDDGSGLGPLPLYDRNHNGLRFAAGDITSGGTLRSFVRRTGLYQKAVTTYDGGVAVQRAANRDGYYLIQTTDWPTHGPSMQDTSAGVAIVGTARAYEPATGSIKVWQFSANIKAGALYGTNLSVDGSSSTVLSASSGASAWAFAVAVDTTNSPHLINVLLKGTGEASKTINWSAQYKVL